MSRVQAATVQELLESNLPDQNPIARAHRRYLQPAPPRQLVEVDLSQQEYSPLPSLQDHVFCGASQLLGKPLAQAELDSMCGCVVVANVVPAVETRVAQDPPLPVVLAPMSAEYERYASALARHALRYDEPDHLPALVLGAAAFASLVGTFAMAVLGAPDALCILAAFVSFVLLFWWWGTGLEGSVSHSRWHRRASRKLGRIIRELRNNDTLTVAELQFLARHWGNLLAWPRGRG